MKIVEEPVVKFQIKYEVVSAKLLSDYKIQITFSDKLTKTVDFEFFLKTSHHPSIRKYLDIDIFKQYSIVNGNLNWNDYDMIFPISELRNGQIS
jgi:hypothetical protein